MALPGVGGGEDAVAQEAVEGSEQAAHASFPPRVPASWWSIVLSWNGREETLACLDALAAATGEEDAVIVVDNGSHDGSPEAVAAAHPEVTLLRNDRNLGFAGGNNVGIRHALEAGAQWVVLINNDAEVDPGALGALRAAAARHPGAGILAGKLFFREPAGRIWFAGQRFWPALGYSGRPRGYGKPDAPEYRAEGPTERAAGAFMAISRAAIDAVGLLDEELFAYVEDVDWSLKVREAGFEVVLIPDAIARHGVSASTGGERASTHALYYGVRNTVVVSERHLRLPQPLKAARRGLILAVFLAQALLLSEGRGPYVRAVLAGWRDLRAGRMGERSEA
jgi:GT2 family glycosyltransferase